MPFSVDNDELPLVSSELFCSWSLKRRVFGGIFGRPQGPQRGFLEEAARNACTYASAITRATLLGNAGIDLTFRVGTSTKQRDLPAATLEKLDALGFVRDGFTRVGQADFHQLRICQQHREERRLEIEGTVYMDSAVGNRHFKLINDFFGAKEIVLNLLANRFAFGRAQTSRTLNYRAPRCVTLEKQKACKTEAQPQESQCEGLTKGGFMSDIAHGAGPHTAGQRAFL